MTTVRWGIIGCGDVTEVKSGPGFQKARGSALVAVMRRDAAKAEDYARRHGVPRWYTDAEALVRDPEVDAVYVATPPSTHCEYTVLAARAGKPVYVEKPMALDHAECRTMIDACAAAGVPLFTAYYRRAMPRFARIKALLDAGAIGTVRVAAVCVYRAFTPPAGALPWRIDPAISGGGLFVDLAVAPARSARLLPRPDRGRVAARRPTRPASTRPRTSSAASFAWALRRARHRRCGASARRATSIAPRSSARGAGSFTPRSAMRR